MQKIILVQGLAGSGKDTFCDLLVDVLNEEGVSNLKFAFADDLKGKCLTCFRDLVSELDLKYEHFFVEKNNISRKMMTGIGKLVHSIKPTYFVEKVFDNILEQNKYVSIISDFRLLKEYNYLVENAANFNIITVKIIRSDLEKKEIHNETSETELESFDFDFIIDNDSTLENLKEKTKLFRKKLDV